MSKEEILQLEGRFTWSFGSDFHIETSQGCFNWSDPDYSGDNSIRPCGTYKEWLSQQNIGFGRDKGKHIIGKYCGPDVVVDQRIINQCSK